MIQIIHQFCQNAGCQPKDLIVEWTPARGACLIGINAKGVKTCLAVLASPDQIAKAIWLCANGQEHLYSQLQQQQSENYGQTDEKFAEYAALSECEWEELLQDRFLENAAEHIEKDWREFRTVSQMINAFPTHPSADDLIDLYERNKQLDSPELKALLKKRSR
jgi:hypothetical protein